MQTEENSSVKQSDALLDEIASESLQSLLTSLRRRMYLGPTHLSQTSQLDPSNTHFPTYLRPSDVLELQGPPGSGKTHILYHLVLTCVLPTEIGGWGKMAAFYDVEYTFDVARFRTLLQSRIAVDVANGNGITRFESPQDVVNACFSRVKLFRPTSSTQLAVSLLHLRSLSDEDVELGLIAIDSLSTFYWSDRFTAEHFPSSHPNRNPLQHILTAIKTLLRTHSPAVVYTNWALYPDTTSGNGPTQAGQQPFFRNHLKPSTGSDYGYSNASGRGELNTVLPLAYHITLAPVPASRLLTAPVGDHLAPTGDDNHPEITTSSTHLPSRSRHLTLSGRVRTPGSPLVAGLVFTEAGSSG